MNQQPAAGTMSPAAKKSVVLLILIVSVALLLLFVFAKGGSKSTKIIAEGDRAPEFTLSSLDGKQVSLSDFRGKIVMLHFWATWCPPCVEEIPTIDKLYNGLVGKDFQILAVSVDEGGAERVSSFLQRNRLALPVLLDPGHSIASLYGTFKFPETYVIDRNGIVKYKVIGARDWTDPVTIRALQDMTGTE